MKVTFRKKLSALIATVVLFLANDLIGLGIDPETIREITYAVVGFFVAQGVADIGKEKATVEAKVLPAKGASK